MSFSLEGGFWLALVRAVSVASLLSMFGTLVFRNVVAPRAFERMPPEMADRIRRRLLRLAQASIAACGLATLAWLLLQSADMADATALAPALEAVPVVAVDTSFGRLVLCQLLALVAVAVAIGRRDDPRRQRMAVVLAALATVLQAGHGHAASMVSGSDMLSRSGLLLASDGLHLLGAGAWLGGLLPLLLLVRDAPPRAGATAARGFSPLGKLCIAALVVSAGYQGWVLIASLPGLLGTAYGWMALVKLSLFAVLLGFAAVNRYRIAPALLHARPDAAKRRLVRSLALQTGSGLAIIAAAAILSGLPPAMHLQPLWPFPDRFTLDTVREDPDFRREALGAVLVLAGGALLLAAAVLQRGWFRWLAVAGGIGAAGLAAPHLDLLFVPAYPTSYYQSPTGFGASAIVQGAALYPAHCASCHGIEGRGDGPAASGLPVPPADLTAAHLWMHSDGELFWWLSHGIEAPEGGTGNRMAMPGLAGVLSEPERWDLIDYIRAHNAGLGFGQPDGRPPPLQAPELQADCLDGHRTTLADLRGQFVRLVFAPAIPDGAPGSAVPGPAAHGLVTAGVVTILSSPGPAIRPAAGLCIAADESLSVAYAIVSGIPPSRMAGTQFLIDADGWLRATQKAGAATGWNDKERLSVELRELRSHPVVAPDGHLKMHM